LSDEQRPEISAHTKQTWPRTRQDRSAGGVAYRRYEDGRLEFALIATHGAERWQLPKGSLEKGENAQEAAVREVEEEVGLQTVCEAFLKTIDFWYWDTYRKTTAELVHKQVDFFLLRIVGGELSDASYEVDSVGWFSPDAATRTLTFAGEQEVVKLAVARLSNA
jgi:8-oxo-dGTP pyrophosphatase MutT (NUDIX family)